MAASTLEVAVGAWGSWGFWMEGPEGTKARICPGGSVRKREPSGALGADREAGLDVSLQLQRPLVSPAVIALYPAAQKLADYSLALPTPAFAQPASEDGVATRGSLLPQSLGLRVGSSSPVLGAEPTYTTKPYTRAE